MAFYLEIYVIQWLYFFLFLAHNTRATAYNSRKNMEIINNQRELINNIYSMMNILIITIFQTTNIFFCHFNTA